MVSPSLVLPKAQAFLKIADCYQQGEVELVAGSASVPNSAKTKLLLEHPERMLDPRTQP